MSPKKCSTATKCSARTGRQSGPSQRETVEHNSGKERGGDRGSAGLSGASDCTGSRTRISWRATDQWNEDQGGKKRRLGRSPEGHRAWWAKARGWAEGHQGREEKEWRSTASYVALPLCCDYSLRPYLRIGVFAAECGSVILVLDVRFFLLLKVKSGYRVLIPQTLLCTWRKETAAGINDDDASSGKKSANPG